MSSLGPQAVGVSQEWPKFLWHDGRQTDVLPPPVVEQLEVSKQQGGRGRWWHSPVCGGHSSQNGGYLAPRGRDTADKALGCHMTATAATPTASLTALFFVLAM